MTSKEQRKLKKRKKREKENRQQTLRRRAASRAKAKEEREEQRREKRIDKLQRELYAMDQHFEKEQLAAASDDVIAQLEKNVEILRALEREHDKEMSEKAALNESLEEQGLLTMEDKMQALHEANMERQKAEAQVGVGGSADCKMSVNNPAEVSVETDLAENL